MLDLIVLTAIGLDALTLYQMSSVLRQPRSEATEDTEVKAPSAKNPGQAKLISLSLSLSPSLPLSLSFSLCFFKDYVQRTEPVTASQSFCLGLLSGRIQYHNTPVFINASEKLGHFSNTVWQQNGVAKILWCCKPTELNRWKLETRGIQ